MRLAPGQVAVVTGAAGGIGRGVAGALAARGLRLALVDRDAEGLEGTAAALRGDGDRISRHVLDVADRAAYAALPGAVLAAHGHVHLLVNNAGVSLAGPLEALSLDDWEWIVGVNFWGVFHGCRFFLPHLRAAGEAHIVNVTSDFALIGCPTKTAYCATKFAVRGLTEALRAELHDTGVGVTCVYPGPVATGIIRGGRAWDRKKAAIEARFLEERGLAVERVVAPILRGIERNAARVLIGRETHAIDRMTRLSPALAAALVARLRRRVPFL
jgi:short-subunit dehydrogenase